MNKFPFITLPKAIILLRVTVALIFIAHAAVRWTGGTIGRFADFLNNKGFIFGLAIVWILTIFELMGGVLLCFGIFTRWIALIFFIIIAVGIIIIHAQNGWFVGEHGTGGMEYSVLLMAALATIAASANNKKN